MKMFKKALVLFFTLILMGLVFLLVINCTLKDILVDSIIKENLKVQITENLLPDKELANDPEVQEILESEEVSELLNKYLDVTIEGVVDENDLSEVDIENDILNFLKENKSVLSEKLGAEVTDEMIDEAAANLDTKELTKSYKQAIQQTSSNLPEPEKKLIRWFKFLVSEKFRIILILSTLINLIIIALLQWSLYKWMKNLAICLTISGLSLIITSLGIDSIVKATSLTASFNKDDMITVGVVLLVISVILYVVYKVIDIVLSKRKKEEIEVKDDENEVSQVVEG